MVAHVNAEVPRHAIEQGVPGIETLANLLAEHEGSREASQAGQGRDLSNPAPPHTARDRRNAGAETASRPAPPPHGEAKLGGELPDLSFKDAIGALRLCLPRQRRDRFVRDYGLGKSLLMLGDASVKGDGRARAPCGGGRLRYGLAG